MLPLSNDELGSSRRSAYLETVPGSQQQYQAQKTEILDKLWRMYQFNSNSGRLSRSPFTYLRDVLKQLHILKQLEQNLAPVAQSRGGPVLGPATLSYAIWVNFLPLAAAVVAFEQTLRDLGAKQLRDGSHNQKLEPMTLVEGDDDSASASMRGLVEDLVAAGLPKKRMVESMADTAVKLCKAWIDHHYAAYRPDDPRKNGHDSLMTMLKRDVLVEFCPIAQRLFNIAHGRVDEVGDRRGRSRMVSKADLAWQEFAVLYLGKRRARQVWDILHMENEEEKSHMLSDISVIMAHPNGRKRIDMGLQESFRQHLLHPGSSTVTILDEFMLIMNTLTMRLPSGEKVDESGVILDLAARSMRKFLKTRGDAARIVIQSLLDPQPGIDGDPPISSDGFSGRISMAMYHHENPHAAPRPYEGQDLLDPDWIPKPVDARATHGDNISKDEIGHVTSIQSDSIFIKELEETLGDRFLKTEQQDFRVEQKLLAMFKTRFDEETGDKTWMQKSDVMLSDMLQSLYLSDIITSDMREPDMPELHFRILSMESWQSLKEREPILFRVPMPSVEQYWKNFGDAFEDWSGDERYLEPIQDLGRMTVELQLEDRTIVEEVTPPQAYVLYGFAEGDDDDDRNDRNEVLDDKTGITRTVQELASTLRMTEDMVKDCVSFWIGKMVLCQHSSDPNKYTVLEHLETDPEQRQRDLDAAAAQAQAQMDEESQPLNQQELLKEHAPAYIPYIVNMLDSLGSLPVGDILQNLSLLAPGGFPYEQNHLEFLLHTMADGGEIEQEGMLWRVIPSG